MNNVTVTLLRWQFVLWLIFIITLSHNAFARDIREYTVKRTDNTLIIDGQLNELEWEAAELTEPFVKQQNGAAMDWNTQVKFLWDDEYLYVGFLCDDPDVWATLAQRDDILYNEEVVEILSDPNDDGINYFEVQVNPLGTVLDLFMNKPYYAGGDGDFGWNLANLKTAVWIDGTVNDVSDVDSFWSCEVAIAFKDIKSLISPLNVPPQAGESWRILPTRYNRPRDRNGTEIGSPQTSAWNQTSDPSFHVPAKFGRIYFSDELVIARSSVEQ